MICSTDYITGCGTAYVLQATHTKKYHTPEGYGRSARIGRARRDETFSIFLKYERRGIFRDFHFMKSENGFAHEQKLTKLLLKTKYGVIYYKVLKRF